MDEICKFVVFCFCFYPQEGRGNSKVKRDRDTSAIADRGCARLHYQGAAEDPAVTADGLHGVSPGRVGHIQTDFGAKNRQSIHI